LRVYYVGAGVYVVCGVHFFFVCSKWFVLFRKTAVSSLTLWRKAILAVVVEIAHTRTHSTLIFLCVVPNSKLLCCDEQVNYPNHESERSGDE